MSDVIFAHPLGEKAVNAARLHEDLRALHGDGFAGVSGARGQWKALFTAVPTAAQLAAIDAAFALHDAAQLTAEQQAEAQRQQVETASRPAAVNALQAYNTVMVDLTDNWAGLAAGAKLEAVRAGVIVALRLARWLVARSLA